MTARTIIANTGVLAATMGLTAVADASRRATVAERGAIRKAVIPKCAPGCTGFRSIRVSTADTRWALASTNNADYNYEALVSRSRGSTRWRVRSVIGGGVPACSQFRDVPRAVVRDLRLGGLGSNGTYRKIC